MEVVLDDVQMQRLADMMAAALEQRIQERLEKKMEEHLEKRLRELNMLKSERTGVQLVGDVVPAPGVVVDSDGDQKFVHRVTETLRRHKGCVIVLKRGRRKSRVKQWKYD